uniref:hypothetical protein n=1 Tax=Altererythrobacter segetis TaxID=1104773 RepID=UPI00140C2795|nr:hypothetical protein [Altererythrobacter segetis]
MTTNAQRLKARSHTSRRSFGRDLVQIRRITYFLVARPRTLKWRVRGRLRRARQLPLSCASLLGIPNAPRAVITEACLVAREWPKLSIAVNLSPIQFCDEGFADRLCRIVSAAGVSLRHTELEVTKGVALD